MGNINLEELTGLESLDELEAALAELGEVEVHDSATGGTKGHTTEGNPGTPPENATPAETDVKKTDSSTAAEAEQAKANDNNGEGEAERVIASKGGKHVIPYAVLEQERREKQQLSERVQQLEQAAAEREKLQKVLERNGIDVSSELDIENLSAEEMEQLAVDYPDIGRVINGIAKRLAQIETTAKSTATNALTPAQAAFEAIPDLVSWRNSDPDRMTFAISVDEHLQADPVWSQKPLRERYEEAARRTKIAFNDIEQEPMQRDRIPASPSDIGQSVQHSSSGFDKYAGMSQEQLMNEMSSMTPDQIEALLASMPE